MLVTILLFVLNHIFENNIFEKSISNFKKCFEKCVSVDFLRNITNSKTYDISHLKHKHEFRHSKFFHKIIIIIPNYLELLEIRRIVSNMINVS